MTINPKRGEIWQAKLDPVMGGEIKKTRPVVVISSDLFRLHNVRIIIPITEWKQQYSRHLFLIKIPKTSINGLDKTSAGNVLQVRSISSQRFQYQRGVIEEYILKELLVGLAITVDYDV